MIGESSGTLTRLAGPVAEAAGLRDARLYNVVRVGRRRLIGEVIRLHADHSDRNDYSKSTSL